MSSLRNKSRKFGRALVCAGTLAFGAVALSGCGFQPLYGVTSSGTRVNSELAYVMIPEQTTRLNQLIRNGLLSTMSPPGGPLGERYRLEFAASGRIFDIVKAINTDTLRRLYKLNVQYRLFDTATGEVIHEGKTFSDIAYDRTGLEFSNIQAQNNAEERAALQVGDDIRTRLAAFFAAA